MAKHCQALLIMLEKVYLQQLTFMSQALGLPGGEGTSIFPANVIVATVKPKQANKKILF